MRTVSTEEKTQVFSEMFGQKQKPSGKSDLLFSYGENEHLQSTFSHIESIIILL